MQVIPWNIFKNKSSTELISLIFIREILKFDLNIFPVIYFNAHIIYTTLCILHYVYNEYITFKINS